MAATAHKTCAWQPAEYLAFQRHRLRPARELLGRVEALPSQAADVRIVDLGAGTCNMAPAFLARWPQARIAFVDSSQAMLDRGKQDHLANASLDTSNIAYVLDTFEYAPSAPVDLIFANAALHWTSFHEHQRLLPRLFSFLKPGGSLAIQMPDSRQNKYHQLMLQAGANLGLEQRLRDVRWVTTERDPMEYYQICAPLVGADLVGANLDMWTTTYAQIVSGENPVADFTSSTGLAPYVEALGGRDSPTGRAYEAEYRKLVAEAYGKQEDGMTVFEFKRFFLVLTKPLETSA